MQCKRDWEQRMRELVKLMKGRNAGVMGYRKDNDNNEERINEIEDNEFMCLQAERKNGKKGFI